MRELSKQEKLVEHINFITRKGNLDEVILLLNDNSIMLNPENASIRIIENLFKSACSYGHLPIVKYLMERNELTSSQKDICFFHSCEHVELMSYWIEQGVAPLTENSAGIICAVNKGSLEAVQYLIEKGLDVHTKEDSALIFAANNGEIEIVKYLIEQGADVHAQNDDAIKRAAYYDYLDIVIYLIEHGADIQKHKEVIIKDSASEGYLDIVEYLVTEHNCDPTIALNAAKTSKQNTIIEWCEKYIEIKNLNDNLECHLIKNKNQKNNKIKV